MFEAASLSKITVAFVALMLRDESKLDIDRPLAEYLAPADLAGSPLARRVTARHVLSHSSGFRNWRTRPEPDWAPGFEPGSRFLYSGEGFVWLARVLEQVGETAFVDLMNERLFVPAGLTSSTFLWHAGLTDRMATGHGPRGDVVESSHVRRARMHERQAAEWNKPVSSWTYADLERAARQADVSREPLPVDLVPNAAASLLSTPTEYAKFVTRLMERPPQGGPLLRESTRAEMLAPQTRVTGALDWGLGVGLETTAHGRWFWHWGDNGSFKDFVIGDAGARRAMVVFTNGAGGHKIYQRIVQDALGTDPASLVWV
jgi:CubicO group peptidase (beta-lactamase class C family)